MSSGAAVITFSAPCSPDVGPPSLVCERSVLPRPAPLPGVASLDRAKQERNSFSRAPGRRGSGNRLLQVASPTAMQSGWFFQIPRPVPAPATPEEEVGSRDSGARAGLRGVLEAPERQRRTQVVPAPSRGWRASQASSRSPGRRCHLLRLPSASRRTPSYRETRVAGLRLPSLTPQSLGFH